jgi:hypothetical protein
MKTLHAVVPLCFALAVGACGPVNAVGPTPELQEDTLGTAQDGLSLSFSTLAAASGSRLKAKLFHHPGGFEEFKEFQDTQLGTACTFRPDNQGDFRCMSTSDVNNGREFADANCSQRAWSSGVSGDPNVPTYVTEMNVFPSVCQPEVPIRWTAFKILPTVLSAIYSLDGNGSCVQEFLPGFDLVARPMVPVVPSTLVKAQIGYRFIGGARLAEKAFFGSDGSRAPVAFPWIDPARRIHDLVTGQNVVPALLAHKSQTEESFGWVSAVLQPESSTIGVDLFANNVCGQRTAATDSCGARPGTVQSTNAPTLNATSCKQEFHYDKVLSTEVTGPKYYGDASSCSQLPADPFFDALRYYELGAATDLSGKLAGHLVRHPYGRLSRLEVASSDQSRASVGIFDEDLETRCTLLSDGRCVPDRGPNQLRYKDANCTQKVIVADEGSTDPEAAACFTGRVVVVDENPRGTFTKHVRGGSLGAAPIPLFFKYQESCFEVGEGRAWNVTSSSTIPVAQLTTVTR